MPRAKELEKRFIIAMRVLHPFYFNRKAFVYYSCHKKSEYFHEVRGNKKYLVFGICVAFVLLGAFAGVSVGGGAVSYTHLTLPTKRIV